LTKKTKIKKLSKDTITKQDAIDFLKLGCTSAEISECFDGFSKMQIAAFKAHITMGTYKRKRK
jgi:hypothetical protein